MIGNDLNAYILAGGSSRRMGVDKLFLPLNGRSLLEQTMVTCQACFKQVKIVSPNSDRFTHLDYQIVLDSPRARGPMAGVIAALEDCAADCCFITAADLADLSTEIITLLVDKYIDQQYLGLQESGGLQPLCGIYHKSAIEIFYHLARKKDFSMKRAVKTLNHKGVALPAGQWRNINYPEDLGMGNLNG